MSVWSYKDLIAWQKAMAPAEAIYSVTHAFPKEEVYGLTSQMRRATYVLIAPPSSLTTNH